MSSKQRSKEFVILIICALIVAYLPYIKIPFEWYKTFFHEISHGIAAILTGGTVERISLNLDGSGLCYTRGGSTFLIGFSGYPGAVLWGALIYIIASSARNYAYLIGLFLIGLIGLSGILWARDIMTILIILLLGILLVLLVRFRLRHELALILQFTGIYIVISASHDPFNLLGYHGPNDAASLSQLTSVPSVIWILSWFGLSVLTIVLLWRRHRG